MEGRTKDLSEGKTTEEKKEDMKAVRQGKKDLEGGIHRRKTKDGK